MLNKLIKSKKESGFTIIEVMIVLAIAGLILVVVLIAVPQLQRNQRNEARRSIASRIAAEIANFQGNNNGNLPAVALTSGPSNFGTPMVAQGFFDRYLDCSGTSPATCGINIVDPRTNHPVGTGTDGSTLQITATLTTFNTYAEGGLYYNRTVICSGETPTATGATDRNYALLIKLEGGASYCIDNQ